MYPIINLLTISVHYSPIYTWLKGNFAPVFSPILQVKGKEKKQAKYSLTLDWEILKYNTWLIWYWFQRIDLSS
jgi:hypothetical protein